jgi:hypothetical protein
MTIDTLGRILGVVTGGGGPGFFSSFSAGANILKKVL